MNDDFVHLHTHSDASAFDGLGKPSEFVELAAEMGQPALALTEHGTGRSIYTAAKAARDCGITYIPGCEMYLTDDATLRGLTPDEKKAIKKRISDPDEAKRIIKEENSNRKERDHITVWALDQDGLRNLYRLLHYSWNEGFHYKPRVDMKVLRRFSEGIAVSTGCPGGVITKPMRDSDEKTARARMTELKDIFGDRLYVEVMPHVPDPTCVGLAKRMTTLAADYGCTVLATQDAHYPGSTDAVCQDALLCIHTKSTLADPDRFAFDTTDYWMKPRIEYLKSANKADSSLKWAKFCDNTVEFADRVTCEVELDQPGRYLAAPKLPVGIKDYDSWVMKLCLEGAKSRGIPIATAPAYKERLFYELREIRRRGFSSYFCVCWEVRKWCRDNGKLCGPGRGSGGGSLVNYLLRITDIDPVKYDLSFDRFLAPGRQGLPDVDLDFASHDRQDVIQHLRDEYGEEHVAHISTHICLGGRATLRDLGRICSVPVADIEGIASMIHTAQSEEAKDDESLSTILKTTKLGKEFAERYPDVAELCGRLEGQLRTVGVHAGGIVISSEVLSSITPMESTQGPRGRVAMTAYDMDGIEDIGCVKLDVLGLTTLRTCSLAFEDAGLDPSFIDFEDTDVLKAFTDQRFGDIFQFDTPSARRVCADFEFRWLGDIAAMTALNRPGPLLSGMVEQFMERHRVKSAPPGPHPIYDEVFKETYGVPVYQEQVIELVKRLCGYSAVDADKFRRAVGKKKGLGDHHEPFVDGACASGMDLKDAEELFGKITGFAQYAFNKSHSYTYSALAFWTMALKVRAPASFYAAALETRRGNTVKQLRLCAEARAEGIPVEPPDVNVPTASGFAVDRARGLRILGSLADIKGIGPKAAKAIADNAPYTSVSDFALRTGKAVNLGHFKALTKASAFRSVVSDRKALAENPEGAWRTGLTPHGPEYADEDEEALVIGSVWPIYRSITGASSFSATLAKVKGEIGPNVLVPGDNYLQGPGGRMVMALPSSLNLYTDGKTGGKTGRAIMVSADGEELSLRIDSDTAEFAHLLEGDQPAVLWTFLAQKGRRRSIERAWPVDGLTRLARTLAQGKGPRLGDKIDAMKPDQKATIPFLVVRRKAHRDKRGNKMLTLGGMAGRDYIRVLVFSSRMAKDVKDLEVGQTRRIQIKKLDRGGLCLGDRDVS